MKTIQIIIPYKNKANDSKIFSKFKDFGKNLRYVPKIMHSTIYNTLLNNPEKVGTVIKYCDRMRSISL